MDNNQASAVPRSTSHSPLSTLDTERRNPRTLELDRLEGIQLARALHAENHGIAAAIDPILDNVARVIEAIASRLASGGRLIYAGAGTSGRLGVLDASECPPTFGVSPNVVLAVIAGGDDALRRSIEGAEDDLERGAQDIRDLGAERLDAVVGISASGRTPYVLGALNEARRVGALTAAIVNVRDCPAAHAVDHALAAETGPEPLTGSTRLLAGTAQKMLLNLISTGVMIRLGKVYSNLMIDVAPTNTKLRDRAVRIVQDATGASSESAFAALETCDWSVRLACAAVAMGASPCEAAAALEAHGGRLRSVIESQGAP